MNVDFVAAMRRAAQLTRAQDIAGAMHVIQTALGRRGANSLPNAEVETSPRLDQHSALRLPDTRQTTTGASPAPEPLISASNGAESAAPARSILPGSFRLHKPLGEALRILREGRQKIGSLDLPSSVSMHRPSPAIPEGAQFVSRSFACPAGSRNYKLYIPSSASGRHRGLVIMLHGCKQNPDDFAVGTNMNAVAERYGVLVAYPSQPSGANASSCWNWFRPLDQMRDAGEPAIIAGLTQELVTEFGIDRSCVFVAGLSAGGAMAAVMAQTYPDLYSAIGVHSGLAYGAANDVMSAFAAMRGEDGAPEQKDGRIQVNAAATRTIVFHGSADPIVHVSNAERIIAAASPAATRDGVRREDGRSANGRAYTRQVISDRQGAPAVEYWLIEGAGHAWSGGLPGGSYTDPAGPDASTEMMRFFFAGSAAGEAP